MVETIIGRVEEYFSEIEEVLRQGPRPAPHKTDYATSGLTLVPSTTDTCWTQGRLGLVIRGWSSIGPVGCSAQSAASPRRGGGRLGDRRSRHEKPFDHNRCFLGVRVQVA